MVLQFPSLAALGQQKDLVDGLSYRDSTRNLYDSRHVQARGNPLVCILRHRAHIMGEQNTSVARSPVQDDLVRFSTESLITYPDDVHLRPTPPEALENVPVEVLIGEEDQHDSQGDLDKRANRRSRRPVGGFLDSFSLRTRPAICSRSATYA